MVALQFIAFAWLPLFGLIIGASKFGVAAIFRRHLAILGLVLAIILAFTSSALLSEEPSRSFGFVLTASIGLFACAGIWELMGAKMLKALTIYAYVGSALVTSCYFIGSRIQGRLTIGVAHPNYLGVVSFGILVCALSVQPRLIGAILIGLNLFIIVETESRSALAAALLGLGTYGMLAAYKMHRPKVAAALGGAGIISTVVLLVFYDATQVWISHLFFLNDRYRGLGTGFTGRVAAWEEAIDLFAANPIFGVGFRMHERYMTMLSSAHNGYLSLLAEVGLIGVVPITILLIALIWRLARRALARDEVATIGISFVLGYLVIAAFERLFLNMGNPVSVLVWIFLLISDRRCVGR
ncbi:MAG TPA: O-antigen ligase family protein [Bryobacteraceae bacterium]|jgi:O-antigen ligase|nr:O-antigen ligase family protein [Bryobacteraceae bacterium]